MNAWRADPATVRRLVVKDWQVFQKQLAGYVAGLVLALALIGHGQPWTFSAGGLLMLILMAALGSFAVQSTVVNERKEQTRAFVMSLPVSPADVFWGKLISMLLIYAVPFVLVAGGCTLLMLTTPLPDGLLLYAWLVFGFMLASYCVSLCVVLIVESEAWLAFWMLALMAMLGPFMFLITRLEGVVPSMRGDEFFWSGATLAVLAGEAGVVVIAIVVARVVHGRRASFL